MSLADYIAAVKTTLEGLGFLVEMSISAKGLSGFEHRFDLAARKGSRVVYLSVKPANPMSLLAEVVKGFDVKEEIIIAAMGEPPPRAVEISKEGRVKIVPFKSAEELVEKLKQILA